MSEIDWRACRADAMLAAFFAQDDLNGLAADAGALLGCPLLVLNDAFRVVAHHRPMGFSDPVFQEALRHGAIAYEAGALIAQSLAISAGRADMIELPDSAFRRRFAPLVSADVRLGYLICVDTDGHLKEIPAETWHAVEQILAKQLFVEASRRDAPFGTAEEILAHLLDGGFPSAPYFRLQTANTYLAELRPAAFALLDLTAYHSMYLGRRHLKDEVSVRFPDGHPFLYRGDVFLFLHGEEDLGALSALAEEFRLRIVLHDGLEDLFELPALYRTAHEALELMRDDRFRGGDVCTVAQLRTALLLKELAGRWDLIPRKLRALAAHDREKGTQYCETLYHYLTCGCSLKKTCEALFAHRNTVLYRIRRMQEDFAIPLDEPVLHADLLLGVSLILFEAHGPEPFLCPPDRAL